MKKSWRQLFRRLAAGCAVSGAMAWSSAMCYAVQLAFDTPLDEVYAESWEHGQNGGFGFGAWNFDGTYGQRGSPPVNTNLEEGQKIDDGLQSGGETSSQYNDIGRAWTLYSPIVNGSKDIARAGRSIPEMQVGQTISIEFDNPIETRFYGGYTFRFTDGTSNSCWQENNCTTWAGPGEIKTRLAVGTFGYFPDAFGPTEGRWFPFDHSEGAHFHDKTAQGARLDFTLTGVDTYEIVMTPFNTTYAPFTQSGELTNLETGGPIRWIQIEFYNTGTHTAYDTDFFIRSMEITGDAVPGLPGDHNGDGFVDAADYVIWRKTGVDGPQGYIDWRTNFGRTGPAGSGSALAVAAVPEPSTFVYIVLAAAGLAMFGLRRLPQTALPVAQRNAEKHTGTR